MPPALLVRLQKALTIEAHQGRPSGLPDHDGLGEKTLRLVYEVVRRRARGESIRSIARALRFDRRTMRRMLREVDRRRREGDDALARASAPRRTPRPSKLGRPR